MNLGNKIRNAAERLNGRTGRGCRRTHGHGPPGLGTGPQASGTGGRIGDKIRYLLPTQALTPR